MELLEIAKANAAKALGTAKLELPASLRAVLVSKETDRGTAVPNRAAQFQVSILRLSKQNLREASARKIWLAIFIWFTLDDYLERLAKYSLLKSTTKSK